jgi:hypothetical protein
MENTLAGMGFSAIPEKKIRLGLIPARIGAQVIHRLGVKFALDRPQWPTVTPKVPTASRSKIRKPDTRFERDAMTNFPTKANVGTSIICEVQELAALSVEEQEQVTWRCSHANCKQRVWATKAELISEHGPNAELVKQSAQDEGGPKPHLFYGVLEIEEVPEVAEVKDKDGKVTTKARAGRPSTVAVVSEEH